MARSWARLVTDAINADPPIRVTAFDGSTTGPPDAPVTLTLRSPRVLSYLASAPGELGLVRAYVQGDLELCGDRHQGMVELEWFSVGNLAPRDRLAVGASLAFCRLSRRPPVPQLEARLRGRRHTRRRDRAAIAYHYDISNKFYELLLGPSVAYTCAVYDTADATLEQAQFLKHELVAAKLGLRQGMRLLDVGCGWGGMVMHAAEQHHVRALGVTLSQEQAAWARHKIAERGLAGSAEVRYLDYRI